MGPCPLRRWVANGSPGPTEQELRKADTVNNPAAVGQWEAFFNSPDKRGPLVAIHAWTETPVAPGNSCQVKPRSVVVLGFGRRD